VNLPRWWWLGDAHENCIAFDGEADRLICNREECETAEGSTLCGLVWGVDFDQDEIPEEDRING